MAALGGGILSEVVKMFDLWRQLHHFVNILSTELHILSQMNYILYVNYVSIKLFTFEKNVALHWSFA